jgi:hypothetical protein
MHPQRERQRVGRDRHGRGHREPDAAVLAPEQPVERHEEQRDRGADEGRRPGVTAGIEAARDEPLRGPRPQTQADPTRERADLGELLRREAALTPDHQGDLGRGHGQRRLGRDGQDQRGAQRPNERLAGLGGAPLGIQAREDRIGGHARGQPEDTHGHPHERLGVGQPRDRALLDERAEVAQQEVVEDDDREAEHDRQRAPQVRPQVGVPPGQHGRPPHAAADAGDQGQQERAHERAGQHAPGEAFRPERWPQQHTEDDDAPGVEQRRQGGHHVPLPRLQRGREQPSEDVEDLCRQDDSYQVGQLRVLRGIHARRDVRCEPGRGPPESEGRHDQQQAQEVGDL